MANHRDTLVHYAIGKGANLGKAVNKVSSWGTLVKLLSKPTVTREKHKDYLKLPRDEQTRLKSVNGWISGAQCQGSLRRLANVLPRDVGTYDLDYPWDSFFPDMKSGIHWLARFECVVLSTRSSTDENPRYRVVMPMKRMVRPDEWNALARIVSLRIDYGGTPMEQVDVVSSRRAQMMFMPTISDDQKYQFHHNEGELFDPDEQFDWFAEHHGDWRDLSQLPLYKGEEKLRKHADKAEDPWLKPGMIGDWCRAWPIEELIAEHLSDKYIPGDDKSGKPRYSYTGGESANGAVIEDDGRFLYSWHGSDPVAEQLVNAWDLYRIHRFGHLDDKTNPEASIMDWPSSKAMKEFVATDARYREQRTKSRYDLGAMFDDVDVGEADAEPEENLSADSSEYTEAEKPADDDFGLSDDDLAAADGGHKEPPKDKKGKDKAAKNPNASTWFGEELEVNKNGDLISSVHNVAAILYNDPRFYGKLRFDDFTGVVRVFGDIASRSDNVPTLSCQDKVHGDRWSQMGHATIRAILATPNGAGKVGYGLSTVAERDIADGVMLAALRNRYHPIKDFIESETWDGVERIERMFIDYLGVPDNAYSRETAKLVMIASVARIYEPGMKFDNAPVLQGRQGVRKSTFIRTLYTTRWFGEVACDLGDTQKVAEAISGKWGNELPEMAAQSKSETTDTKSFLSRQEDVVRMAYAREVSVIKRQAIFWGSTNEDVYLKDTTGNRRFWPLRVQTHYIDTAALAEAIPQLWAEALVLYKAMRAMYPKRQHEDLPLMLSGTAEQQAKAAQDSARAQQLDEEYTAILKEAFDKPITLIEFAAPFDTKPHEILSRNRLTGLNPENVWVIRNIFRRVDAAEALGMSWPPSTQQQITALDKAIKGLSGWAQEEKRRKRYMDGNTAWFLRQDADSVDQQRGFTITDAPAAGDEPFVGSQFTEEDLGPEDPDDEIDNLV